MTYLDVSTMTTSFNLYVLLMLFVNCVHFLTYKVKLSNLMPDWDLKNCSMFGSCIYVAQIVLIYGDEKDKRIFLKKYNG